MKVQPIMLFAQNHVLQKLPNITLEVRSIILNARLHHNEKSKIKKYNDDLTAYNMKITVCLLHIMFNLPHVMFQLPLNNNVKRTTYYNTSTAYKHATTAFNEKCTCDNNRSTAYD